MYQIILYLQNTWNQYCRNLYILPLWFLEIMFIFKNRKKQKYRKKNGELKSSETYYCYSVYGNQRPPHFENESYKANSETTLKQKFNTI